MQATQDRRASSGRVRDDRQERSAAGHRRRRGRPRSGRRPTSPRIAARFAVGRSGTTSAPRPQAAGDFGHNSNSRPRKARRRTEGCGIEHFVPLPRGPVSPAPPRTPSPGCSRRGWSSTRTPTRICCSPRFDRRWGPQTLLYGRPCFPRPLAEPACRPDRPSSREKIPGDDRHFRKLVRGRVKRNLSKYISRGEMIGKKGATGVDCLTRFGRTAPAPASSAPWTGRTGSTEPTGNTPSLLNFDAELHIGSCPGSDARRPQPLTNSGSTRHPPSSWNLLRPKIKPQKDIPRPTTTASSRAAPTSRNTVG